MTTTAEHVHEWKMTMHLDGCHFWASFYRCECGATRRIQAERDVEADPYSMVWMGEPTGEEPCERCAELIAGAKPVVTEEAWEPGQ